MFFLIRYRIAGNFGKVFKQFGEFGIDSQIKNLPIELNAWPPTVVGIQITEFKLHQYQWRAISPKFMLAKVTRYVVCIMHYIGAGIRGAMAPPPPLFQGQHTLALY